MCRSARLFRPTYFRRAGHRPAEGRPAENGRAENKACSAILYWSLKYNTIYWETKITFQQNLVLYRYVQCYIAWLCSSFCYFETIKYLVMTGLLLTGRLRITQRWLFLRVGRSDFCSTRRWWVYWSLYWYVCSPRWWCGCLWFTSAKVSGRSQSRLNRKGRCVSECSFSFISSSINQTINQSINQSINQ